MAEVKWIKLKTDMFDDEKIRLISSIPEADAILVIWIRLITLAGKCNCSGYIYFTETMPYTEEMLATIFNKPVSIIRLALRTFLNFGMIEIDEKGIYLVNWEKHQNVDGLEKIKEQTRKRVAKYRDRQKQLKECNVTETFRNAIEEEKNIDKELDIEKEKDFISLDEIKNILKNKYSI